MRKQFDFLTRYMLAFARPKLKWCFAYLGAGILAVSCSVLLFKIMGLQGNAASLGLPLTVELMLRSDVLSKVLENPVVLVFSALLFAPFVEEFVFRDLVITLARGLPPAKASVIMIFFCGVVFGMAHGSPFKIMVQGVIGILLAKLYLKNGPNRLSSYLSCVFVHSAYNFIVSVLG